MATEAQRRAANNYRKRSVKSFVVSFYPKDKELYAWVKENGGAAFLRELAYKAQAREKPLN